MTTPEPPPRCVRLPISARLLAKTFVLVAAVCIGTAASAGPALDKPSEQSSQFPIRGLHLSAPAKKDLPAAFDFIRDLLPKEGVNTLILEFNYGFDFHSRQEFSNPSALGREEAQQLAKACREAGIELIPLINCLGHQSWAEHNGALLTKHPEFDETIGKHPGNKGIYCRSYCPRHPEVHKVVFDLIDELVRACEAKAFHVGMDEVFILADPDCPRCKEKKPSELLADEVEVLHEHLKKIGCRMWMWGDRFIDGKSTGIGKWEASENGTEAAIDRAPKDIVICDWHYEKAHATPEFFARKGFEVVACPWRKPTVALAQLEQLRVLRSGADPALARCAGGVVQTTWCGFTAFVRACRAQQSGAAPEKNAAAEAAGCFLALFKNLREKP